MKNKNPAIKRTIAGPIKGRTNMKEHLPASTGNIHNKKFLLKFNSFKFFFRKVSEGSKRF